jgi:hypothetical protein
MGWSRLVVDHENAPTIDEYMNALTNESARSAASTELELSMKGQEAMVKRTIHLKHRDPH